MASSSTVVDVILVHRVQLKPMIKAQISGRMVSIGISDVASVSPSEEVDRRSQLYSLGKHFLT